MMRYERKVVILGATLAALLALLVAGAVFSPERRAERAESRALLSAASGEAAALELGLPKIALAKKGDSWYLVEDGAALPVQEKRVESFLAAVAGVKRLRPIGRSKDAWKGLDLEEGKAKPVTVRDAKGRTIADFSIGGYGPTGAEVYLRLAGSDASFAAEGSIASYLSSDRRSWLDLRVVPGPIPEGDVEAIAVKSSIALDGVGKPPLVLGYSIRRDKDGWTGVPGQIDAIAVSSFLRSIINIEGEDIVASPPSEAFSPVTARIELSLGNGGSKVLEVGAPAGENRFYLRLAGSPYVYSASAYGLRNALKDPAGLIAKK
jgi:hypothetical protein